MLNQDGKNGEKKWLVPESFEGPFWVSHFPTFGFLTQAIILVPLTKVTSTKELGITVPNMSNPRSRADTIDINTSRMLVLMWRKFEPLAPEIVLSIRTDKPTNERLRPTNVRIWMRSKICRSIPGIWHLTYDERFRLSREGYEVTLLKPSGL